MKKKIGIIIGALAIAGACFGFIIESRPAGAEVVFFDVGQGDSAFIETPNHFQMLIDGGPDSTVLEKLGKEMPFWDRAIDFIVLTHPDSDHITGLLDVLKKYEVKNILWTGILEGTAEEDEWLKLIKEEKANVIIAEAGEKIILQENPEIYFLVLYPNENLERKEIKDNANDASIVGKLVFEKKSFLFAGDISSKIEKQLSENLNVNILKVAHHGSKYSTSVDFLQKILPEEAVISVGENSYGHPAPETLQRLENFGIKIHITKQEGDIKYNF